MFYDFTNPVDRFFIDFDCVLPRMIILFFLQIFLLGLWLVIEYFFADSLKKIPLLKNGDLFFIENFKNTWWALLLVIVSSSILVAFFWKPFLLAAGIIGAVYIVRKIRSYQTVSVDTPHPPTQQELDITYHAIFNILYQMRKNLPINMTSSVGFKCVKIGGIYQCIFNVEKDQSSIHPNTDLLMKQSLNREIQIQLENQKLPNISTVSVDGKFLILVVDEVLDNKDDVSWDIYVVINNQPCTTQYLMKKSKRQAVQIQDYPYIAWDWDLLRQKMRQPVLWTYSQVHHCLYIGQTGSGKTTAVKVLLPQVGKVVPNAEITVCDFKNQDFSFLEGHKNYYSLENCLTGLKIFYQEFLGRQSKQDSSRDFRMLVFDEWSSFLNQLDPKKREEALKILGNLLALGRSFNFHVLISQQRGDSQYFHTARDNFGLVVTLGNISKESASMFGFDQTTMNSCSRPGQGHLLLNGAQQTPIVVPNTANIIQNIHEQIEKIVP